MTHLVVGGDLALLLAHHPGLLLRAGDHAHDPFLELVLGDLALAVPRREQRRLVDEIREVGAREAWRLPREHVDVDLARERLAARMDFEDLPPTEAVGT